MNFDYIIVGGGSAGCVLAARLSEDAEVSVALVEAGPVDKSVLIHCPAGLIALARSHAVHWDFSTVAQKGLLGRRGWSPRGKVLGGSSSVNAMIYTRGHRADYDHWAAQGNPGWSYDEVLPYFRRAEHNERLADRFHGQGGPLNVMDLRSPNPLVQAFVDAGHAAGWPINEDFNGASQEGVGAYQVTQRVGERFSAAKAYLRPHLGRPNLTLLTGAHTTRVVFEGRRAVGIELRQQGQSRRLRARREVLLAAGALQSPQLLLLSGVGDADALAAFGIAPVHALPGVGRHLHDHIDIVQVIDAPALHDSFGLSAAALPRLVRAVGDWRARRSGLLTSNLAEAGGFIRSQPAEAVPDLQLHLVVGKLADHGRKTLWGHGYSGHVCLLRPQSRGSVTLDSPDPTAAPCIDPNFFDHPDDLPRLARGFRLLREILQQPALARLGGHEMAYTADARSDTEIEAVLRRHADTIYHPVGTCRMGPGPDDVVDAALRVHGLQGLRVVDASIMPRIVGGNTHAPVIMIAEKAADLIKAAWRGERRTEIAPCVPEKVRVQVPIKVPVTPPGRR